MKMKKATIFIDANVFKLIKANIIEMFPSDLSGSLDVFLRKFKGDYSHD